MKLPTGEVEKIVAFLRTESTIIEPATVTHDSCHDPADLPVLGTAQAAGADYLVTGDKDLLVLQRFGKFEIISPRKLYERLHA